MPAYSRVAYSPTGHLLFVRNGALLAQSFDPQGAVLSGEPMTLSTAVKAHNASDGAFDVSRTGILIFRGNEILPSTKLVLFDRRGRQLRQITANGLLRYPRFSPDGNRIAAEQAQTDVPNADLWVFDAAVGRASQFTSAPAPDVRPAWSPDGKRVAFSSKRGTAYDIYVKGVDVLEDEKVLWHTDADKMVEDWSPDGRTLSVTVLRSGLWTYPVDTTKKPTFIRAGGGDSFQSEFAPNGRWLAYASASSSGHSEVYVEPVPATGEVFQVSTNGGTEPHWRRDTGELFYLTLDHWMAAVAVPANGTWDRTLPNRLFRVPIPETLVGSVLLGLASGRIRCEYRPGEPDGSACRGRRQLDDLARAVEASARSRNRRPFSPPRLTPAAAGSRLSEHAARRGPQPSADRRRHRLSTVGVDTEAAGAYIRSSASVIGVTANRDLLPATSFQDRQPLSRFSAVRCSAGAMARRRMAARQPDGGRERKKRARGLTGSAVVSKIVRFP